MQSNHDADLWLRDVFGTETDAVIAMMAEYYRRGGRWGIVDAGLRVLKYDRDAERLRQRLYRARLKER